MLTFERANELVSYDPTSGLFVRKIASSSAKVGDVAGCVHRGKATSYSVIRLDGKLYLSHRVAMLLTNKEWPCGHVDHIDGNGLNNAIGNLRVASGKENLRNMRLASRNTSGFKGVSKYWYGDGWTASCGGRIAGKRLGIFPTAIEAAKAYDEEAKRAYGPFAKTNKMLGLIV